MSLERALHSLSARGAALATSLLLLVVMTALGIAASHLVRIQSQSATHARDRNIAFQKAETGLRGAERWLDALTVAIPPTACEQGKCRVYASTFIDESALRSPLSRGSDWWRAYGWEYATGEAVVRATPTEPRGVAAGPPARFVIEEYDEIPDTLTISPLGPPPRRVVYRISAAAEAGESRSVTVLQSTFVRRFE